MPEASINERRDSVSRHHDVRLSRHVVHMRVDSDSLRGESLSATRISGVVSFGLTRAIMRLRVGI